MEAFIKIVNKLGYLALYRLTDAADYCVPQRRSRYFLTMVMVSLEPIDQYALTWTMPGWAELLEVRETQTRW